MAAQRPFGLLVDTHAMLQCWGKGRKVVVLIGESLYGSFVVEMFEMDQRTMRVARGMIRDLQRLIERILMYSLPSRSVRQGIRGGNCQTERYRIRTSPLCLLGHAPKIN